MKRSIPKTWSQETLALKEQFTPSKNAGFLNLERRTLLMMAIKTAMAAGLCYWLATLAGLQDGYWGSISAIIVLQSNVGSTVTASRERLIGTLIGAAIGAAFSFAGNGLWPYLLAVITSMVTCSLLGLKNSSRLAGVTVTILMLVHRTGSNWLLPLHRVLEVLLGIAVALAISTLVFPSRARKRLQDGLAQEFLLLGSLFNAILEGFLTTKPENLAHLHRGVNASLAANAVLREAARNEPSNARASLEGLQTLEQFGKEIHDILQALELAIQSVSGPASATGYAQRLEPEIGKLSTDIHRGFDYVAGCIHRWQFDIPPKDIFLEDDIASLEQRMAAVRPHGIEYPQEEILRAYAVQLHLKQLARLLRATRLECARIVA